MTTTQAFAELAPFYDLIVVGGGITGAGIAHQATLRGARVLLVEQGDFASGTSSASSKLVHGGLRYLANGQWRLTLESVRERNRLLRRRHGLVERQPFLMPVYAGATPGLLTLRAGLAVYDLMGGQWRSQRLSAARTRKLEPEIRKQKLRGAVCYEDAATDDARLVLKLILEAVEAGATALNYTRATGLLIANSRVRGLALEDVATGSTREVQASVVINAAGVQAAELLPPAQIGGEPAPALRPLRGSHLLFPLSSLPIARAVGWMHPRDGRPVFVYPWQGKALYGTTDVDHAPGDTLRLSSAEAEYLMEGLAHQFPDIQLDLGHAVASYAGIRPVVAGGASSPSAESRESAMWQAPGWIGITGGKLTTFRRTAQQVLRAAATQQPRLLSRRERRREAAASTVVEARYGAAFASQQHLETAAETIADTPYCWAELRWAARHEAVRHLDDLLLRRTRLGLLLPGGGESIVSRAATVCADALGWDAAQCEAEVTRYRSLWQTRHAPESA